jgi:hypothetical protein
MRVTDNFRLEVGFRDTEGHHDRSAIVSRMTPNHNDKKGGLS